MLVHGKPFQHGLTFASKARAYPSGSPSTLSVLGLTANVRLGPSLTFAS